MTEPIPTTIRELDSILHRRESFDGYGARCCMCLEIRIGMLRLPYHRVAMARLFCGLLCAEKATLAANALEKAQTAHGVLPFNVR